MRRRWALRILTAAVSIGGIAACASAAAPATSPALTITRRSQGTIATLVYQRGDLLGNEVAADPRIAIERRGRRVRHERVPLSDGVPPNEVPYAAPSSFIVRDLDGDGEREIVLDVFWTGHRCCVWTRVYRYVPARRTYVTTKHVWWEFGAEPSLLRSVAGRPEFVSRDVSFGFAFGTESALPIQVWSFDRGRFRKTTRQFPRLIRIDAASLWRLYLKHRGQWNYSVRTTLAAWAAEEYLLWRGPDVWPRLAREAKLGWLKPQDAVDEGSAATFLRMARAQLRKLGYIRG